jgi:glutathione S-transferase
MMPRMLELYISPGAWGTVSTSPFCAKVAAYVKLAGIDHKLRTADFRRAPRGKIPYIRHGDTVMGDSTHIIDYLKTTFGDPLDAHLTAAQRARGHLIKRTCEESLYWVLVYSRWNREDFPKAMKGYLAGLLPGALRPMLLPMIHKKSLKQLAAQGTGRFSRADAFQRGVDDLEALAEVLGDGPFAVGDAPTSDDATLYAWLDGIHATQTDNPLTTFVRGHAGLQAYLERVRARLGAATQSDG